MAHDSGVRLTVLSDQPDPTTVGNHFVSNYPPYSVWSPQYKDEALDRLKQPCQTDTPLGLYVHIPFCRKRCHFCYFRVYTDRNKDDIRHYLDSVIAEMRCLADRPYISGRKLKFIYFGGGTPSYLSQKQLTHLMDGLRSALSWDGAEEVAFECEPGTINSAKLHTLVDLGVTRLSLGIENFDDDILTLNNRAHQSKEVYRAYEWAQSAGFGQINIDLIAGMLGETDNNWRLCIDKTVELAPDSVTIYQMEIPHNTMVYRQMQEQGKSAAPVADWPTKRRWVAEAYEALESAGYTIASAYTAVKETSRSRFVYRDALWEGADMLGVGVSSFGHVGGTHYQNHHDIGPYITQVSQDHLPIYRALTITDEQRMIRRFILKIKLGRLSRRTFIDQYAIDVFKRWAPILKAYEDKGYLSIRGDYLTLTRQGLLRADQLLAAFFLPEHQGIRYT